MTEREKRIEEMKKLFCFNYPTMCKACCFEDSCLPDVYSNRLYDADYRKADEVRKETAKDIIYGVAKLVEIIEPDAEVAKYIYNHLFEDCKEYGLNEKEFAKEFGVEVEE